MKKSDYDRFLSKVAAVTLPLEVFKAHLFAQRLRVL